MFTSSLLAQITCGKLVGNPHIKVNSFSIDSRNIKKGDVFIALKGSRFDGNEFVKDAFEKGAIGAIAEKLVEVPQDKFLILVNSSLEALKKIAKYKRENFKGKVIGVAGSAGKTTTKELLAHLLSFVGKVYKSPGNLNSQIGLPLSVANAPLDCDFWVLEHGASKRGEIKELVRITKPFIRVITKIGEEHLEGFRSLEGIILGNGELFCFLSEPFIAVIPEDTIKYYGFIPKERLYTFGEKDIESYQITEEGVKAFIEGEEFFIPVPSLGIINNLVASIKVLRALGYKLKNFKEALSRFKPEWGRMEVIKLRNFTVINDTYNANPPSVENAIRSLSLMGNKKKIVILGDMLELGKYSKELHRKVGELLNECKINVVFFSGEEIKEAYNVYRGLKFYTHSKEELKRVLKENKEILKGSLTLVKASRGLRFEDIVEFLRGVDDELSG